MATLRRVMGDDVLPPFLYKIYISHHPALCSTANCLFKHYRFIRLGICIWMAGVTLKSGVTYDFAPICATI